jgi:ATP-binding cassette subfamily B protein
MSPAFYRKYRTGDLMAHATNDVDAVTMAAREGVLAFCDSLLVGSMVVVMMVFTIDWRLTLLALLPMPLMAWITEKYGSILHKRFDIAQEAFSNMNDYVQENISGIRVVKAFGQEEAEKKAFSRILDDVVVKNIGVAKIDALFDPTIYFVTGISMFLAVSIGSWFVLNHEITIGELTQFTMYLGQLVWPMLGIAWTFNILERGRASYDRIQTLLAVQPEISDAPNASPETPSGDLEIKIDSFTYPQAPQPVLKNIEITVRKGETLGIVGKTGSGKTTLFRLLLREYASPGVKIKIGGKPIEEIQLHALRKAFGYVPQDPILFSATIAENIAFGKPDATQEEIEYVAKLACIHEDILQFPDGYQTIVGERGVTLSGGQKQRISIARALLLDPEILIFDDSLSAVDAKTEHLILEALRENRKGKTTLIAAHRLSAVEQAEQIIVLEDGEIVEHGTHAELIRLDGWYKDMYERQQLESSVFEGGGSVGS